MATAAFARPIVSTSSFLHHVKIEYWQKFDELWAQLNTVTATEDGFDQLRRLGNDHIPQHGSPATKEKHGVWHFFWSWLAGNPENRRSKQRRIFNVLAPHFKIEERRNLLLQNPSWTPVLFRTPVFAQLVVSSQEERLRLITKLLKRHLYLEAWYQLAQLLPIKLRRQRSLVSLEREPDVLSFVRTDSFERACTIFLSQAPLDEDHWREYVIVSRRDHYPHAWKFFSALCAAYQPERELPKKKTRVELTGEHPAQTDADEFEMRHPKERPPGSGSKKNPDFLNVPRIIRDLLALDNALQEEGWKRYITRPEVRFRRPVPAPAKTLAELAEKKAAALNFIAIGSFPKRDQSVVRRSQQQAFNKKDRTPPKAI